MNPRSVAAGIALFVVGLGAGAVTQSVSKPDASLFKDKAPKEAAEALLQAAEALAGKGSWENIAVARTHYLCGDKVRAQTILDQVTAAPKVKENDYMRIGWLYYEADEWDKAAEAFTRALALKPKDAGNLALVGALYNLRGDRAKAEDLFTRSLQASDDDFWAVVAMAGSYVGVKPTL